MTITTIFGDVSVLINKWALIFHVTASAESFLSYAFKVCLIRREVRVMTISACYFPLRHRVMGETVELHLGLNMTTCAKLFLLLAADFLLWPLV